MDREVDVGEGSKLIVRGIEEDGSITNVDVELVDAYGARWSATVLSIAEIRRLMRLYRETGECMSGAYFRVADLLILAEPSLTALVAVIEDLVHTGTHRFELAAIEDL